MATKITQIDDAETNKTFLRVEGELLFDDAVLLEKIALDLRRKIGESLKLDLADIDFIDSEAAAVIRRLKDEHGFKIEGLETFLQKIVTQTEQRNSDK